MLCRCGIKAELNRCKVGDAFQFGEYEQDRDGLVKSPIEWVILEKEKGRVLMVSKICIGWRPYNTTDTNITWEDCSLREWLNGTFLEHAFSQDEQDMIKLTSNESSQDKVSLLSRTEVQSYFKTDEERKAEQTEYAAEKTGFNGYGPWWLRSQTDAYFSNAADTVDDNGSLYLTWSRKIRILAFRVDQNLSVRPAIWVDIGQ